MAELATFLVLVAITASFAAGWIHALVTGRIFLLGPFVQVKRKRRPVSYVVLMALLLLPVALVIGASILAGKYAFPLPRIPAPPAAGYAEKAPLTGLARASAAEGYFPAALLQTKYRCRDYPEPVPILDEMVVEWYSEHLAAANEPSLLKAVDRAASRRDVYRFTWLRSFHKPMVIRIEEHEGGALQMTASRLSGMGGYEPGAVEARIVRRLSHDEAKQFRRALSGANGLRLKAVTCDLGFDGAQWIFEGVDRGRYRFVERWTPDRGSVRALGLVMLGFTGWEIEPVY